MENQTNQDHYHLADIFQILESHEATLEITSEGYHKGSLATIAFKIK